MKFKPYNWQQAAIDHAISFLRGAQPGQRQLYASPTGSGKSVVELCVREQFPDAWIVSPRQEIIDGMMDKLGVSGDPLEHRFATPVKLRNRMLSGLYRPQQLILDETHHESAETWQQLDLLAGLVPAVGYTATPFRGSPRSTREFLERWGEPEQIISFAEACSMGVVSMPEFSILPLVDDDIVDVRGGEFDITSIDAATVDRLGDCAEHMRQYYCGKWDRPTIFAMPSSACCVRLQQELLRRGMMALVVSAATPPEERKAAFAATVACTAALLHINIVSEGVDLPLRRLVDLAPTMSPVRWVQQLGRITRPSEEPPAYICTNRNILRHAYTLEGAVRTSTIIEAERAFPKAERASVRALGLEAIGRFKPSQAKLVSGVTLQMYALSTLHEGVVVEYACLVHPAMAPIWATKVNSTVDGVKQWGVWRACDAPLDVRGFASVGSGPMSEKQQKWWQRSAVRYGLDPAQEVTRKSFQALPVLADLGLRLQ